MAAPSYPAPSLSDPKSKIRWRGPHGLLMWSLIAAAGFGCAAASSDSAAIDVQARGSTAPTDSAPWALPTAAADSLHRSFDVELHPAKDGSLLSTVIADEDPFTEALPSWNVPSGVPFTVEIRVLDVRGDAPDDPPGGGTWSPWLRIGDWATPTRDEDTPIQFSAGKVGVDVLKLTAPYRAAQLRFKSPEGTLDSTAVTASLVLSEMTRLDAALEETRAEEWPLGALLKVAARSQRSVGDDIGGRICSPTSVAMVSAYHGANIPTRQMAEALLDPHYDIYGNWNRAVQGPATLGVPGRLVRVSSWSTVAAYLQRGLPVVASIRAKEGELAGAPYKKTAGHLLVVTGLGPAGAVHVNDPAAKFALDVPRVYQRADMERVWFANGGVGYVFAPLLNEPKHTESNQ